MLHGLREDVRQALHGLRRSPGFTTAAVVTLALGIGANLAVLDLVDRLMFRPLAYLRDPEAVHRVYVQSQSRGRTLTAASGPYTRMLDLERWTTSFAELAGFSERELAVGEGASARERRVAAVSASYFDFFDARPVAGRFFAAEEDRTPVGEAVVVLSYAFWRSVYGGRDALGESLRVGNIRATIVGIAPERFAGIDDANPPVAWVPITTFAGLSGTDDARTYHTTYRWGWMSILARRRPGVGLAEAEADATQALNRSWRAAAADDPTRPPVEEAKPRVRLSSPRPGGGPDPTLEARTALWVALVAGIILVIACANVVHLILTRSLRHGRDTAVRLALGASRGRLVQRSVVEGMAVAGLGGAAALLVAPAASGSLRSLLSSAPLAAWHPFADGRTLGVVAGLTLLVGIVVGLVPVLLPERGDVARALRGGTRAGLVPSTRLRAALLVVQAGLSVTLLVGAALFVRSLAAVEAMPMGYDADRVLLVKHVLRGPWPGAEAMRATRERLIATAQALPGVEAAAWVSSAPFVSTSNTDIYVAGTESARALGTFTYQAATVDYFRVMGTRIKRGRGFTAEDRLGAPEVAVVSESMASVLWPGQEAIGRCLRVREQSAPCRTVVGIAEDMVQRDLAGTERYHYYMPLDQYPRTSGNGLLLRLRGLPAREAEGLREQLQWAASADAYLVAQPLLDIVQGARRSWRLGATMFVVFGGLALLVAAVGLYGAIAYDVAQRRQELAVRLAVGARRSHVLRLVVGQGLRLALAGVGLGTFVAWIGGRFVEPLLFRQPATDPSVYAGVGIAMLVVAAAASAWPALRAAATDPSAALRAE